MVYCPEGERERAVDNTLGYLRFILFSFARIYATYIRLYAIKTSTGASDYHREYDQLDCRRFNGRLYLFEVSPPIGYCS